MVTWILILSIYSYRGAAITTTGEFKDKTTCELAGVKWKNSMLASNNELTFTATCIQK